MGTDLHGLHEDIVRRSHPRLVALLERIRKHLRSESDHMHGLIAEIDRELANARIQ